MKEKNHSSKALKKKVELCLAPSLLEKRLREGDRVEIVAPGFSSSKKELRQALLLLKTWGLNPKVPMDLFGKDLLCANKDPIRFSHLKRALESQDSYVIFCLRGGYGSFRLLPFLDQIKKPARPKLLVGYSDITFLHSFVNSVWKWPSLHAPHLNSWNPRLSQADLRSLKQILFRTKEGIEFHGLQALNLPAKNKKRFSIVSSVAGGNLRTLTSLIGTKWIRTLDSKIVVLEDVKEKAYQVDRMLTQWEQAGIFRFVKAIVFGNFLCETRKESLLTKKVIQRFAESQSFPVLSSLSFGHGQKNMPIPFGTKAELIFVPSNTNRKQKSFSSSCDLRISCDF